MLAKVIVSGFGDVGQGDCRWSFRDCCWTFGVIEAVIAYCIVFGYHKARLLAAKWKKKDKKTCNMIVMNSTRF